MTFFAYQEFPWSISLSLYLMPIIIVGRFAGTLGLVKFFDLFGYGSGIRTIEVFFMGFAGLIRGAIAFGLVLRLDGGLPNRELIVTTALTIVVGTTIFFGSLVGLISGLTKEDAPVEASSGEPVADKNDDAFFNAERVNSEVHQGKKIVLEAVADDKSEHDSFKHPNENLS